MKITKTIQEIHQFLQLNRQTGKKISFVPTMGALHHGHISLVEEAKKYGEIVIASIFVNQAQFNDPKDFQNYPKTLQKDLEMLEKSGASAVFVPEAYEIFPPNFSFQIIPNSLTNCLCGQFRAGHFEGVCLVVAKFFNIINPDFALFGEKDFQQLAIIRKMVFDLNFPLEIIACPTIREVSGLAMSSRNQRLSFDGRQKAAMIFKILCELQEFLKLALEDKNQEKKNAQNQDLQGFIAAKKQELLAAGFSKIDYLEIREEENLDLIGNFEDLKNCLKISEASKNFSLKTGFGETNTKSAKKLRIFIAAYLDQVRLIDNLEI